ncbi:acyl-CoA dehydrogenase [Streptomyces tateyamensis]|uniref:Acyl-CoA dehydrogenase n=1 Tax=Streptomyces tateyamensis TaxID=565073 RepID=A0A2V4P6A3_9ACTN|nr:acyl-CoA dehydrogenase family protein [Streptomyces tateyamensis]PYC78546.1 acyl-CoA dehydrogenase [Streptomyces tateyamensis]
MGTALHRPTGELAVPERVARLEELLGDPTEPANPVGYTRLLEADRRAELCHEAEGLLDEFGMSAEYVPTALGGRLDSVDTLVRVMRPVFRRDVSTGMGYGFMSFMGASDVWMAGTERQRARVAELLLAGGKVSIAQHETAHSNDLVRSEIRATPAGGGFLLGGTKPMINNLARAGAVALFCRGHEQGSRSHSVMLIDPAELPGEFTVRPYPPAVGMRGCQWAGLELGAGNWVSRDRLLGPEGSGLTTALRSFQISRTLAAALAVGAVDASLRIAVRCQYEDGSRPSGREALDPQRTAGALSGAFVDLLLFDALAMVATRAVHLLPGQTSLYSAAVKYLLPRVLGTTMYDLSIVLGSQLYVREGTLGAFQKHLRDLQVITLGHAGSVACQATLLPQLRGLARHSWFNDQEAPPELFRPGDELGPFRYQELDIASGHDSLAAVLVAVASALPGNTPLLRVFATLVRELTEELRDLRDRLLALPVPAHGTPVGPGAFALSERYSLVLAAAAVVGVWWWHQQDDRDPFLASPAWAVLALRKIARALGARVPELPAECQTRVHHEVLARFGDRRSFDLYNTPVAG